MTLQALILDGEQDSRNQLLIFHLMTPQWEIWNLQEDILEGTLILLRFQFIQIRKICYLEKY
jgi:hypothetical protein